MNRELTGADTEQLTFSRTLLGYDPLEVRAFVREANQRIARLSSPGSRSPDESGAGPEPELGGAIASAVREIDEVLESARLAAQRIRSSAEVDVSDSVESAQEQARQIVAEAEDEAFTLRQVAWEAATEMLETASSEVAELRADAERDALCIIDDAERRAIRNLAAARRDSENVLQTARVEYDRLVELASATSPEAGADGGVDGQVPDGEDSEPDTSPTKRLVVEIPAENEHVEESEPPAPSEVYGTIRVIPATSTPAEALTKGKPAKTPGSDDDEGAELSESAIRLAGPTGRGASGWSVPPRREPGSRWMPLRWPERWLVSARGRIPVSRRRTDNPRPGNYPTACWAFRPARGRIPPGSWQGARHRPWQRSRSWRDGAVG